jgi:hypothetical protein
MISFHARAHVHVRVCRIVSGGNPNPDAITVYIPYYSWAAASSLILVLFPPPLSAAVLYFGAFLFDLVGLKV